MHGAVRQVQRISAVPLGRDAGVDSARGQVESGKERSTENHRMVLLDDDGSVGCGR